MDLNIARKRYDKLFIPKTRPNEYRPMVSKNSSLVDELKNTAASYLTNKDLGILTRTLNKLEEAMYDEMERKDLALLREINDAKTVSDKMKERMDAMLLSDQTQIMTPLNNRTVKFWGGSPFSI